MTPEPIPHFEGTPVDGTRIKVSGTVPVDDLADQVVRVDDIVNTMVQFRVVGVDHVVDDRTGNLIRVQRLKPVEMNLFPLDPNDPNDDGIIRAFPVVQSRQVEKAEQQEVEK